MSTSLTTSRTLSDRVAEEIRVMRARRLVKQSELAKLLDTNDQWLSVRLRGRQPIDLNDLERIAEALEIEVTDLIPSGPTLVPPLASSRRRKGRTSAYGLARTIVRDRPQTSASRPATYGARVRPATPRVGAIQRRRRGAAV